MSNAELLTVHTAPKIFIQVDTLNQMQYCTNAFSKEIMFYAYLKVSEIPPDKDNKNGRELWIIHGDLEIPEQTVSAAEADVEAEQEAKLREELADAGKEFPDLRVHCHSHVDMAVTPSAQDELTIREFADFYGNTGKMVRIIINRKGDIRLDAMDLEKGWIWRNLSVTILPNESYKVRLDKLMKRATEAPNYPYNPNYQYTPGNRQVRRGVVSYNNPAGPQDHAASERRYGITGVPYDDQDYYDDYGGYEEIYDSEASEENIEFHLSLEAVLKPDKELFLSTAQDTAARWGDAKNVSELYMIPDEYSEILTLFVIAGFLTEHMERPVLSDSIDNYYEGLLGISYFKHSILTSLNEHMLALKKEDKIVYFNFNNMRLKCEAMGFDLYKSLSAVLPDYILKDAGGRDSLDIPNITIHLESITNYIRTTVSDPFWVFPESHITLEEIQAHSKGVPNVESLDTGLVLQALQSGTEATNPTQITPGGIVLEWLKIKCLTIDDNGEK